MSDLNTKVELSVVMPVYNEEDNLEPLMEELEAVLEKTGRPFRSALRQRLQHRTTA